ncbi:MAG: hypothetical protein AAFO69_18445, partial [Bacteroidota bacterium]
SEKQLSITTEEQLTNTSESRGISGAGTETAEEGKSSVPTIESLLATIPFDTATQNKMLGEVEVAHYELGKIYHFQLQEDPKAVLTFQQLLKRFDQSTYKPEVLYLMFLIAEEEISEQSKNRLIAEFPNSIYAKLAVNPNYREESNAITAKLQKVYSEAYQLYLSKLFKRSRNMVDNALREYPDNEFTDNIALLRVMIIGKTEDIYKYQFELNSFIKTYEDSDLKDYVAELIKTAEEYQANLVNSSRAKFSTNLEKKHLYAIVYETKDDAANKISSFINTKLADMKRTDLTYANLIFDDNRGVIIVNEFPDKEAANSFLTTFKQGKTLSGEFKSIKISSFIISDNNFNTLYQTKELDSYLKFYRNNY